MHLKPIPFLLVSSSWIEWHLCISDVFNPQCLNDGCSKSYIEYNTKKFKITIIDPSKSTLLAQTSPFLLPNKTPISDLLRLFLRHMLQLHFSFNSLTSRASVSKALLILCSACNNPYLHSSNRSARNLISFSPLDLLLKTIWPYSSRILLYY